MEMEMVLNKEIVEEKKKSVVAKLPLYIESKCSFNIGTYKKRNNLADAWLTFDGYLNEFFVCIDHFKIFGPAREKYKSDFRTFDTYDKAMAFLLRNGYRYDLTV